MTINNIALITGGARGIGFATARLLAHRKFSLILVDLNTSLAQQRAQELADEFNIQTLGVGCDITNIDAITALRVQVEAEVGEVSHIVNSAAILDDRLFLESTSEDRAKMINVCLMGPMHILAEFLPGMTTREFGRVVCMASDAGRLGQARLSYYAAAKGGVIALVKSVAQEVGRYNVTLNVVSPGATNTELRQEREAALQKQMGDEKYAKRQKAVLRMYPVGRIGVPEDPGYMIDFLLSDQASWITGQVISVNGGFAMP